jgi:hypothetical protein
MSSQAGCLLCSFFLDHIQISDFPFPEQGSRSLLILKTLQQMASQLKNHGEGTLHS